MKGEGRETKRRSYRPRVESLEALRLLSQGTTLTPTDLAVEHGFLGGQAASQDHFVSPEAWDSALAEVLDRSTSVVDARSAEAGLAQLDRYLSRAWYRAGIDPNRHDDCTQAVYVTLLQNLGRDRFEGLLEEVGDSGIREVLSRETPEGPDFFRAVDTVKKRAQRERTFQPLDDSADLAASPRDDGMVGHWRGALDEAIAQSLNPREAALIQATLRGETPMEIASRWGLTPKTVSNEKARVIQKLRTCLGDDGPDA